MTMPEKISGYVSDDLADLISNLADYHDIPKTRVVELLLREGALARDMRIRQEMLAAKVDELLATFGTDANEAAQKRAELAVGYDLPSGVSGVDLVDEPYPYFGPVGEDVEEAREHLDLFAGSPAGDD